MPFPAGSLFVSTGVGTTVTSLAPSDLYNSFTYTLTAPALTTSAAVYDSNDVLQKTLWSAVTQTAGTHRAYWAGDMDDGSPATGTPPFYAKVLSHNVEYVWEGVIGNLSSSFTGSAVMTGLNEPMMGLSISGTDLWVSVGYNEAQYSVSKFALSDVNTRSGWILKDQGVAPYNIATDATNLYFASDGGYNNSKSFAAVMNLSTGANVSLSSGTNVTPFSLTYSGVDVWDVNPVCTISIASPAVVTVTNSFVAGVPITFSTTGALPTGITAGTTYYVIATGLSGSSFQFSATLGGAAVNTSGSQSGQHKVACPTIAITGIAVNASYMVTCRPGHASVRVFNKTTGALVNTITAAALSSTAISNQIAFDSGNNLWVIEGTSVVQYTNPSVDSTTGTTIAGFSNPLALAGDASGNIWIADGGTSHQVFKYSSAGSLLATFGTAGGYLTDPAVSTSKLWFYWPTASWDQSTSICPDSSGGFWIVDTGNSRILHFTSAGGHDETMMWMMAVYNISVDHADPSRVFIGLLEFDVDYTEGLTPGPDQVAWTLVRNWTAGGPSGPFADVQSHFAGFTAVETLSNGRTYGKTGRTSTAYTKDLYELPSSGLPRLAATFSPPSSGDTALEMYENGDLRYRNLPTTAYGYTETYYVKELTGFDGSHNPIWASAVSIGSVLTTATSPWFRGGGFGSFRPVPITSSGIIALYDGSTATNSTQNQGFHVGGVPIGGTAFSWQAAPTGVMGEKETFQTKAVDGTVNYGGNQVWTYDRHIIYGYHGENYTDLVYHQIGQANRFTHFYDDGLFIGQFGVRRITYFNPTEFSRAAGCAGNSFSNTYAYANGNLYWYHGDESVHGGVHRWRIDGVDTISEQSVTLNAFP